MDKKVSIIVPVCNSAKYLENCLKSICAQTLKNIEIICINDGSSDESFEILSSFEKKDKRIRLVSKINEGYGCALNIGLNLAGGEYVGIVEPSDFIDKKMFEKLYSLSKKCDADIVKSAYFKFFEKTDSAPERKEKVSFEKYCKVPTWFFRISECPSFLSFHPSIWTSLYKRTFLNNNSVRFVEAKGFSNVDNPFQLETMLLAQKIAYTGSALYFRRQKERKEFDLEVFAALFDRADEMEEILTRYKNKDRNISANIYKRELGFIYRMFEVLNTFDIKNLPYEIQRRIEKTVSRMDEDIVKNNPAFNIQEKNFYNMLTSSASNRV